MLIPAMLRRVHLFCLSFAMSAGCLLLAGMLTAHASGSADAAAASAAHTGAVDYQAVRLAAGAEFR